MKPFRFPLQRMLDLRSTQLEIEQAHYKQCLEAVGALDRARAQLEAAGIQAEVQVRKWSPLAGGDLAALATFRGAVRRREQAIAKRRGAAAQAAAAQMTVMLHAQRRCRLLERLRERRLTEWRTQADKDLEILAAESYLARWPRDG